MPSKNSSKKKRAQQKPFRKRDENTESSVRLKPIPLDLFTKLSNAINPDYSLSRSAVKHIWERHGCYENAKRQESAKRNRGKMPSYFKCCKVLIKALESTLNRPNWTRSSETKRNGKTRFRKPCFKTGGAGRFKGKKYRKNLKKHDDAQNRGGIVRKLHFKTFTKSIGTSGLGYGVFANADNKPCRCCCVVVDPRRGLITAFPILTADASLKGEGAKTNYKQDPSSISTTTSDYDSMNCDPQERLESARSIKDEDDQSKSESEDGTELETKTTETASEDYTSGSD